MKLWAIAVLILCWAILIPIPILSSRLFFAGLYQSSFIKVDEYSLSYEERKAAGQISQQFLVSFDHPEKAAAEMQASLGTLAYTNEELSHLLDVKAYTDVLRVLALGASLSLGLIVAASYRSPDWLIFFRRALKLSSYVACISVALLMVWILVAWNHLFTSFHQLLFKGGTWSFAADSLLITLFPERLWQIVGFYWLGFSTMAIIILWLAATLLLSRRRE